MSEGIEHLFRELGELEEEFNPHKGKIQREQPRGRQ